MITYTTRYREKLDKMLRKRIDKGLFRSLFQTAASIRKTARELIRKDDEPAEEGQPIHSKGLAKRKDAILFDVDEGGHDGVVGFAYHAMGEVMHAHEFGDEHKGEKFEERPVMGPALKMNLVRFGDNTRGILGES